MTKCEDFERRSLEVEKKPKGYTRKMSAGDKVARKYRRASIRRAEYKKLKAIVPAVAKKKSVTKVSC